MELGRRNLENACGPSPSHDVGRESSIEKVVEIALPSRQSQMYFKKHCVEKLRIKKRWRWELESVMLESRVRKCKGIEGMTTGKTSKCELSCEG